MLSEEETDYGASAPAEVKAMIERGFTAGAKFREDAAAHRAASGAAQPRLFEAKPPPQKLHPPPAPMPASDAPAEGVLTRLDTCATTVEKGLPAYARESYAAWQDTAAQRFRFRETPELRALYLKHVVPEEQTMRRADRMARCGLSGTVFYDRTSKRCILQPITCGVRTCSACCARHRQRIERIFSEMMGVPKPNEWRFITLTLRSTRAPLAAQLDWLQASFRRLRQTTMWKSTQRAGRGVIEITWNRETQMWHPHLHIVSKGSYLTQQILSNCWKKATQGSFVVDIRAIGSSKELSSYVSKYVGKPPDISDDPDAPKLILEWHKALEKRRMVITYGKLPKIELSEDLEQEDEVPADAIPLGNIDAIASAAERGDPWSLWVMACLCNGGPAPYPEPERKHARRAGEAA